MSDTDIAALESLPPGKIIEAPTRQLSVVEHAIKTGATAEQLQALLELQVRADNHQLEMLREKRRMDEEDRKLAAKRAFDEAMTRFRAENIVIPKTKQVEQRGREGKAGPKFMQAEFDVVCSRLSPVLAKHGFSFRHDMRFGSRRWVTDGQENDIAWVYVTCHLTHEQGHAEALDLEGPPDSSGAKNPLQEMQSSASYLKRQSLLAITGTATGGEDDENRLKGGNASTAETEAARIGALVDTMIAEAKATTTDKAACDYWRANNAKLVRHPNAHDEFKAAFQQHRRALAQKAQGVAA